MTNDRWVMGRWVPIYERRHISSTIPLPPREQVYSRSCSNKHTFWPILSVRYCAAAVACFCAVVTNCAWRWRWRRRHPAGVYASYHPSSSAVRENVCVFITAVPNTKLCALGEEDSGGHVIWDTTSRGLCGLGWPTHTSERGISKRCKKWHEHHYGSKHSELWKNRPIHYRNSEACGISRR